MKDKFTNDEFLLDFPLGGKTMVKAKKDIISNIDKKLKNKKKIRSQTVSVRLPIDLLDRIEEKCEKLGISKSEAGSELFNWWVSSEG